MKSISINNRMLHEVEMLLLPYDQRTISYLKYPKHRIQFEIKEDKLFLNIPVSLALELYRAAILPQNSDVGVSVKVSGKRVGEFRVVDFRYANSLSKDRDMVSITFQRVARRST